MLFSVKGFPVEPMTRAPAFRQRLANGMSAVITISSGFDVIDDPVVGRIEPVVHDLECQPLFVRGAHPRVGDQRHLETAALGNAVDLLFDRTRIGVDEDVQQPKIPPLTLDRDEISYFGRILSRLNNPARATAPEPKSRYRAARTLECRCGQTGCHEPV